MGFFDSIKEEFASRAEKRKEEQDAIRKIKLGIAAEQQKAFEDQFKKDALEVAISQAKQKAAQASGLQKLRQVNRLRHLQKVDGSPATMFGKLGEYTRRNIAKREENLKRTEEMRGIAAAQSKTRTPTRPRAKPFGSPGWK